VVERKLHQSRGASSELDLPLMQVMHATGPTDALVYRGEPPFARRRIYRARSTRKRTSLFLAQSCFGG
jgi:hypothetical protein